MHGGRVHVLCRCLFDGSPHSEYQYTLSEDDCNESDN